MSKVIISDQDLERMIIDEYQYGQSYAYLNEDGTIIRLDPTRVRIGQNSNIKYVESYQETKAKVDAISNPTQYNYDALPDDMKSKVRGYVEKRL